MLGDYLGEEKFRDGLRYYLKKHSYKNTETEHLWEAFEKVSKKPVTKLMKNWTSLSGYPVIEAKINKNNLELSQSRFFGSPISKSRSKDKTIWSVPISIGTPGKTEKILLSTKNTKVALPETWAKVNIGEAGFYRTSYSKDLLEKLISPVLNKEISARDRLGS
jgi:aminopeptidase N